MIPRNRILASLPPREYQEVCALGSEVPFAVGEILHEAGSVPSHVYFPIEGSVSLLVVMSSGAIIEAGFVGVEGAIGTVYDKAEQSHFTRATVIAMGRAFRIPTDNFERAIDKLDSFAELIRNNNNRIAERGQQIAACNLTHQLEPRLCRWLLQVFTNSHDPVAHITQENLAQMLGVNRARLNETLKGLELLGALELGKRGSMHVIDVRRIKARACDCCKALGLDSS